MNNYQSAISFSVPPCLCGEYSMFSFSYLILSYINFILIIIIFEFKFRFPKPLEYLNVLVKVELFGRMSRMVGAEKIQLQVPVETKVKNILQTLLSEYGEGVRPFLLDRENRSAVAILVNEQHVPQENELREGDVITLVPILAGG